jgi:hypothetical protein
MASRVRFNVNVMTVHELLNMLKNEELEIPPHQRDYCWDSMRQGDFIASIIMGLPTQSIILRKMGRGSTVSEGDKTSLEDGRQRLETLRLFLNDELSNYALEHAKTQKFSELSIEQQSDIRSYQFSVTVYRGATTQQQLTIFDHFQNGIPLSKGERLHSLSEISPLVNFVKKQLMTANQGIHDEASTVWGIRAGTDKKRVALLNATALCAGLAFGSKAITKKWDILRNYLYREIDSDDIISKIRILIRIYTQIEARYPERGKKVLNNQWDVGKYNGYIIYSLNKYPEEIERLVRGWVAFLSAARAHPQNIDAILHFDVTAARSWNVRRWELGYLRVFNPAEARRVAETPYVEEDSDDDTEE